MILLIVVICILLLIILIFVSVYCRKMKSLRKNQAVDESHKKDEKLENLNP